MKALKRLFILTLLLATTLVLSCKKKAEVDKCSSSPCAKLVGFGCVDGVCLCPQSSFRIGNYCLSSLAANEYYGTGCTGLDTITLQVGAYNAADYNIQLAYRKSNIGSPGYSSKGSLTQPFAGFRYRDNNKNLDSIHFFLDTGFPTFTVRDTIRCLVTGSGRFLEGDKLKIKFRYRAINQNNRLVDSCEMILHK